MAPVVVETQPIVKKYSKEDFLKAPWCLIKRFFSFHRSSILKILSSLFDFPSKYMSHSVFETSNQENWFSKIFHHSLETFLCVCVFPLQALVWNWGLFIWTIWLFRLGSLLPPLNLHPSYPSDIHTSLTELNYVAVLTWTLNIEIDAKTMCDMTLDI